MGNGVCSRRQKRVFQSLLVLTVVFGIIYGGMFSYELHKQLKRTEVLALKYQQHQESLSAQLQVVYEHRSRLEKSLQKERLEHKKAKEDYLVYKLESQQTLNKEKQDSSTRFHSLHVQHQMLKNQHDDLKKQFFELQEKHQVQSEDHGKVLEDHRQKFDDLQQTKELEISRLKESAYNLREENKQLRKAHQDVHIQLQDARATTVCSACMRSPPYQVEELKRLKPALGPQQANRPTQATASRTFFDHKGELQAHRVMDAKLERTQPQDPREEKPVEERRTELAEEERAQVGQAQEEEKEEGEEERAQPNQPDENALEHERGLHQETAGQGPAPAQGRVKSAYEAQLEQQRLAAQQVEERRQLQLRQEALHQQRLREQAERERHLRQLREREEEQHRQADHREQLLREEQLRRRSQYENMDADIGRGKDQPHDGPERETDTQALHQKEVNEEDQEDQQQHHQSPAEELNPEDDPNNQGEDELEEAGQQQQMVGNPDQQEDNLDEQYQEEGEDEVQEDLAVAAAHQKQEGEEEDEDPYNEENGEGDDARRDAGKAGKELRKDVTANEEDNYEEEDGEEEVTKNSRTNRRAEM
ncbi:Golgi integral membrane protein 4a isoform X2 [Brienomyrus brachyistius]|uniref:Golgi integral membrane protein 4a isoform X2 n=1 Tax=Brienomyrus brachyistius TaxID=42636 RepID=UPI0020B439DA|nr:Golgi integral membrane protein 4a isoform X2 [Brienomyrus brachyistius]